MPEQNKKPKPKKQRRDNIVRIGKKSATTYALSAIHQFEAGAKEVEFQGRGNSVKTCIDSVERLKRLQSNVEVADIQIDTFEKEAENRETKEKFLLKLSTISIKVKTKE